MFVRVVCAGDLFRGVIRRDYFYPKRRRRMKRAVSISIGSSKRNKSVTVELLGEQVTIERIGTDGDME